MKVPPQDLATQPEVAPLSPADLKNVLGVIKTLPTIELRKGEADADNLPACEPLTLG